MELTGKIIALGEERGGISSRTGSEWKLATYVLETQENYPRKMAFEVFGADRIAQFAIKVGEVMTVSFDIDAHEYNGRWFNSIRAWKVDRNVAPAGAPVPPFESADVAPFPPAEPAAPAAQTDDNPFGDPNMLASSTLPF